MLGSVLRREERGWMLWVVGRELEAGTEVEMEVDGDG